MSPTLPGWKLLWSDEFNGAAGSLPDESKWVILNDIEPGHFNDPEKQWYIRDKWVVSVNGESMLHIKPQWNKEWYSARLEGRQSYSCPAGKQLRIQAELRTGYAPWENQSGIWPAFWTLGQDIRNKIDWPHCGEMDIFENAHGTDWAIAALHWGNIGDDHSQLRKSQRRTFNRNGFNEWAAVIDRRPAAWKDQSIAWLHNGAEYFRVYGHQVNTGHSDGQNEIYWKRLAHWAIFPVLNVAVGSTFEEAGEPNAQTAKGLDAGMQVKYVAIYESN
ncbi:Beta-glucanase [Paramyrothecium foliicola]|nr:Beta-glucanase [Paramyrothecium foliicola]